MILLMFGWKLLGISNTTGSSLYGRYKCLGKALEDLFEMGLQRWKDQSRISEEEWARMAPKLRKEPPLAVFKGLVYWSMDLYYDDNRLWGIP